MESLAPWAEPVLMSAEELFRLPDDGWRYELVEGRLVRMSPTGGEHGYIVRALFHAVDQFVEEHRLGTVLPGETGFLISPEGEPDIVLAPDLAFVRGEREQDARVKAYPRFAPDLVIEVASPSQGRSEMAAKAQRWLRGGVRLVWIVFPGTRTVEVWRGENLDCVVTPDEDLFGEDVLPGFVLPVGGIF
jgi:Uma2 family endonuclease